MFIGFPHVRVEAIPIDELRDHREYFALLITTATSLQNNQRHSPIQELQERNPNAQTPLDYILVGGKFRRYTFKNTCVLDSLLAGCHIVATAHPNIRELFMRDSTINAVMILLDNRMYVEAKALWLINLDLRAGKKSHFKDNDDYTDVRGYVRNHLPNFSDLICAMFHYDDERRSPNPEDHVYRKTVSKFEALGDVRVLGLSNDPQLILVNVDGRINGFPPLVITDDYEREFRLQFLLLGMITANSNHMVSYISWDEGWWLYDDTKNPPFRAIAMEDMQTQDYAVHLAAYVNVSAKYGKQD